MKVLQINNVIYLSLFKFQYRYRHVLPNAGRYDNGAFLT